MLMLTRTGALLEIAYASGAKMALAVDHIASAAIVSRRGPAGSTSTLMLEQTGGDDIRIDGQLAVLSEIHQRVCEVMAEIELAAAVPASGSGLGDVTAENWYVQMP